MNNDDSLEHKTILKTKSIPTLEMGLPGCSEETNQRKTQMYIQSAGIGWSDFLREKPWCLRSSPYLLYRYAQRSRLVANN